MIKRILLTLAVIVLLAPSVLVAVLLYSEAGLQLVVRELWRIPGISIQLHGASGRLAGPLHIDHFEFDQATLHVSAEDVNVDPQPFALLSGIIKSGVLKARNVIVQVKESQTPAVEKPATTPHFLPRSMRVMVDNIDVRGVHFAYSHTFAIDADHVMGNLVLTSGRLDVSDLQIAAPMGEVRGELQLTATQPLGLSLKAQVTAPTPHGPNLAGLVDVSGNVAALKISSKFTSPSVVDVTASIATDHHGWQIDGAAKTPAFSLAPWLEKPPFSVANAALKAQLNAQGITVQGDLTVPEIPAGPLHILARGQYAEKTLTIHRAQIQPLTAPARIKAQGRIRFAENAPDLDLQADWTRLQWPLKGSAIVSSAQGRATLKGELPYAFTIAGDVTAPQVVVDEFTARGSLSKTSVSIEAFTASLLQGSASGSATLGFAASHPWSLAVDGLKLNPGVIRQEWPGQLDFSARARGTGLDARTQFSIDIDKLQGRLRRQPLQAQANVQRTSEGWRTQGLRASFGRAHLIVDGSWEKTVDAKWSIQNLQLDMFASDIGGTINTAGAASGTRTAPRFAGDIQARGLHYGEWRAAVFDADADIDLHPEHQSHINLLAEDIGNPESRVATVDVQGRGTIVTNSFKVDVQLAPPNPNESALHLNGTFDGQLHDMRWLGAVNALRVTDGSGRTYDLTNPASLELGKETISASELCLRHESAQLCAQGQWHSQGAWQIDASARDVPLRLFAKEKSEIQWQGQLRADVHAGADAGKVWTGNLNLDLSNCSARYQSLGGGADVVEFGSGHVEANATPQQVTAQLHVATPGNSVIDVHGNIDRTTPASLVQAPLNATLRAHTPEAKLLPLFVNDIDRAAGELDIDAQVTGSLSAPRVNGLIALKDAELDAFQLNLALRAVNAQVRLVEDQARIDGSAKAGDGTLQAHGILTWHGGEPSGTLHLQGDHLLVADLAEYRVVASPNLDFKIDGRNMDVNGVVTIPSARIQPKDLSGAVQASSDARLINDQRADAHSQFRVSSDIRIVMGDDVRLDTFGLQGKLDGSVQTLLQPNETPLGRGELSVSDGRYTAYGQKLEIKRGRLLFDRTSLDDPGLDIQAERKVEQITAGVNVRGTLRAPTLQLYSEPSMSQSEIFSYLIMGKAPDKLQGQEATTMRSISSSVSLQGGGFLASQLGHRIGLEQVEVETTTDTATNTKNTSLVLGKFLSPRLFVSYGISLTESINTLKLRYTISDHWVIKTEAGQAQGADLEYTIER